MSKGSTGSSPRISGENSNERSNVHGSQPAWAPGDTTFHVEEGMSHDCQGIQMTTTAPVNSRALKGSEVGSYQFSITSPVATELNNESTYALV